MLAFFALFTSSDAALMLAAMITVAVPSFLAYIQSRKTQRTANETKVVAEQSHAQTQPNGGGSMRDSLDRIERMQRSTNAQLIRVEAKVEHLDTRVDHLEGNTKT